MTSFKSTIRLVGLESLRIGNVAANGAMQVSASMSTIGYTVPDSANFIFGGDSVCYS